MRGLALLTAGLLCAGVTGCSSPPQIPPSPPRPTDPGAVAWTADLGAEVWAAPATDADTVYVGDAGGGLHALRASDGTARWTLTTGGALRGTPTLADGTLYLACDDGLLYAVRAADGHREWSVDIHNTPILERDPYDTWSSSVTVDGDRLYVGSADQNLYALAREDGEVIWTASTTGVVRTAPAVGDGLVAVGSDDSNIYVVDADSGEIVWNQTTGGPVTSSPVIRDGVLFVGSRGASLVAHDLRTGDERWSLSFGMSWVQSTPVPDGDTLFIGSSDLGAARAVDVGTGDVRWEHTLGGWPWTTPAVGTDTVYLGAIFLDYMDTPDATFVALDKATGEPRWTFLTGDALDWAPDGYHTSGVAGSPALVGDRLVVFGGLDGTVYALGA